MIDLFRGFVLKVLYPFLMLLNPLFKNKKDGVRIFIINLNNKLVKLHWGKKIILYKKSHLLLLLPHCLQIDSCNVRITNNIFNCKRCGNCIINDIIKLTQNHDMKIFIATGGNMARKIVRDIDPLAIIAIACERDLCSGIVDVYPLPVIGIINERPAGPCFNTTINKYKIIEAIKIFEKN
ncbi:MAG: DUF116 domain-containing protein [Thermodesulfovibrionales bacterium]|nr:DUF116 domain-containing protein [Thermodesulfovibrionales bacterium]